jgi:hypothetical protein
MTRQFFLQGERAPGIYLIGEEVILRAGHDAVVKRKISVHAVNVYSYVIVYVSLLLVS